MREKIGLLPLGGSTVTPRNSGSGNAERGRALDIVRAVTDHQPSAAGDTYLIKNMGNHVGFGAPRAIFLRGTEEVEVIQQAFPLEDGASKAFAFRRRRHQPEPVRAPTGEEILDPVEHRRPLPAAGAGEGHVGVEGLVQLRAGKPQGAQRFLHRRPRDPGNELVRRVVDPDCVQGVEEAVANAGERVDQGAVNVQQEGGHATQPKLERMTTVGDVVHALETAYPPRLAESWDAVGLICGDPAEPARKVVFALDCTQAVAERAVELGADLLVVHHPLLMRGVTSVAANTPKGKVVHTLIRGGCALFAAHTNADSARPGVSDKLAELVGITPGRPIKVVDPAAQDLWGVHIPPGDVDRVMQALFDAGAGHIGNYSHCAFQWDGRGGFTPEEGADPTDGHVGEHFTGEETRVQFVAPSSLRGKLTAVLRGAHPYEEPAFDVVTLESTVDLETATGLGRVGKLAEPMTLRAFTQQVADALPETAWGVRVAGDPDQMVQTVAVSSGSGDSFLDAVSTLGVDVYVTSDLRHHPVDEHLRAGGPAVIDTAHWASEFPWTSQASEVVAEACPEVETEIITLRTDPWTISAHPKS